MNQEERTKKVFKVIYISILCVALTIMSIFGIYKLIPLLGGTLSTHFGIFTPKEEVPEDGRTGSSSFTFIGVGDNLIHGAIYYWQELAGGDMDFTDIYSLTEPYSAGADLAYINGETICAGKEFGYISYPAFNGPSEILDAVVNAGFDWMSVCSNHTYDAGTYGLDAQLEYLNKKFPNFTYTGSSITEKESLTPKVINVNGIRVGVQSYTYGINGWTLPDDQLWKINMINKAEIEDDIETLKEVSDVQLVTMHWGTEYSTDVNEEQKKLAAYLNELGVDVIIGTHPHVIEPAEIIHGPEQDTLCYYSLGNFLSCQDQSDRMVGGMASFRLNYNFETKEVSWEDVAFVPTITYFDSNYKTIRTTTIFEYNDSMAATHCYPGTTLEFVRQYVSEVMGDPEGIEVILQ